MNEDGGDESPPRSKRKIKRVMIVSSSSGSDSEDTLAFLKTRKKKLRIISDDGTSDSSGSSVVCSARRHRSVPKLRDSEVDSDSSVGAGVCDNIAMASTSKQTSGFASDSSEGNSEKCSICLLRFTDQNIGTPINCEHIFCLDCITEWSRNVNSCPVDRITFESIVVRRCIGGSVLRTEPVKVMERRPSFDILMATVCEICARSDNEDTMLLCDGCDLGYHMQCLTPPLTEVPATEQWFCPNCDIFDVMDFIDIEEVSDLLDEASDLGMPTGPRPSHLRAPRTTRRSGRQSSRNRNPASDEHDGNSIEDRPSTSSGTRGSYRPRTRPIRQRRKRTNRRTRKVIIEYEIEENGNNPIAKRFTVRKKKRQSKRRPRTVGRRSHVQRSVRARLQSQRRTAEVHNLPHPRLRDALPTLDLFGTDPQLDLYSDDEVAISEGASTMVATRPTPTILNAYRQARRKMITVPSPQHASSAPDILSSILESQTIFLSKKSIVSVSVDGNVNIKLQKSKSVTPNLQQKQKKDDKIDLSKYDDYGKKVPSYPGQSRGSGGGWGGGYRPPRDQPRGGGHCGRPAYDSYRQPPGSVYSDNYRNNNMRRNSEPDFFENFSRRPHQFPPNDETYFDRQRRNLQNDPNRPQHFSDNYRHDQNQGRFSTGPSWQPYGNPPPMARQDVPPATARHSFGGFENPLDMRMGQVPFTPSSVPSYSRLESATNSQQKPQPMHHRPADYQPCRPHAQPQSNFSKSADLEKSEDEKSDPGLVIDTEKYDPTEPTNDDDSGGEDQKYSPQPSPAEAIVAAPISGPVAALSPPAKPSPYVEDIIAEIDTSKINVPPNILDNAVRQVLQQHRNLIASPSVTHSNEKSDEDSDGDCPNFSIYSATSVHIANSCGVADEIEQKKPQHNSMEDLVQEDDDVPIPEVESTIKLDNENPVETQEHHTTNIISVPVSKTPAASSESNSIKSKTEEEYKEKVSKRCPITTSTRNPIKIKLNTPSLIKRVSLYDEEDGSQCTNDKPDNITEEKLDTGTQLSEKHDKISNENITEKSLGLENDVLMKEKLSFTKNLSEVSTTESKENIKKVDEKALYCEIKDDKEKQGNTDKETIGDICQNDLCTYSKLDDEIQDKEDDENLEKMTESISETEDERSYTPCLDENKLKDASFETDKDKALEGLDTEMISEEEENEMFSETERPKSEEQSVPSPIEVKPVEPSQPDLIEKKKTEKKKSDGREDKKKKKKDSKKEGKDKSKSKKKAEVAFKKLSKSGKERNYRERDKDDKKKKDRRSSSEPPESKKKRKEKRKDLERYDVRTLVSEKRRKVKDPFGRDVSPRARSPTRSVSLEPLTRPRRRSLSRGRRSISRGHTSPIRNRRTPSRPRRSPIRRSISPVGLRESPRRRSAGRIGRSSPTRRGLRRSPSPRSLTPRISPRRRSLPRKRRRRSGSRPRRKRSPSPSPRRANKKKKRIRSDRSPSRRPIKSPQKSPHRKARSSRSPEPSPIRQIPSPSIDSQLLSPRTPPEPQLRAPSEDVTRRRRRDIDRPRRRVRDPPGPSKEVFTSGDNILVSVSFKDQERGEDNERRRRRENKRDRRHRRRNAAPIDTEAIKPVAIIDLERSPFRELTPSPKNVIVLSDSEPGERDAAEERAPAPEATQPPSEQPFVGAGPKTPPEPSGAEPTMPPVAAVGPSTAPPTSEQPPAASPELDPHSPDAYDPFEPTRSASGSPGSARSCASADGEPTPPRTLMTLEAAQRTNMSADEVLDRRPLSPAEKVLALLQSTRDTSPEPPPGEANEPAGAGAAIPQLQPRIVLPSPTRAPAKLFPGKPSPIKSNPVKPMQAVRPPSEGGASPYSPGSSDFGDLFEPRDSFEAILRGRRGKNAAKVPVKLNKKKGKTQVGVKIDDENLKILDELPSSAVEMQVKSKFLKKLNRQERVVEEVKLVLKPHYNKKHVTKDEYKHILRRAVPKICHNKTGEINPAKIQSLVEAYVKKFRKRRKLGLA
ncbi:unnamed protein product [Pieris brassicae]|uniref:PHD and RING finger domain-containing protein 1 n=1 Tax=Pieris brassicae TaxID=7116 RepID=A0A9P0TU57_PIEBR|nr:unnamed protein product [Pieris brassicae]